MDEDCLSNNNSRRTSSVASDPRSEYSDQWIDLKIKKRSLERNIINIESLQDRSLYEYTLSKQSNIFKSYASSELAAAVKATHINTSLIQNSFDTNSNHNTGTFKKLDLDETSIDRSSKSLRRRRELGAGLLSPSEDEDDRKIVLRPVSNI